MGRKERIRRQGEEKRMRARRKGKGREGGEERRMRGEERYLILLLHT